MDDIWIVQAAQDMSTPQAIVVAGLVIAFAIWTSSNWRQ